MDVKNQKGSFPESFRLEIGCVGNNIVFSFVTVSKDEALSYICLSRSLARMRYSTCSKRKKSVCSSILY